MPFFLHFVLHVSTAAVALSVRDSLVSCIRRISGIFHLTASGTDGSGNYLSDRMSS